MHVKFGVKIDCELYTVYASCMQYDFEVNDFKHGGHVEL
jgi:hypothetical protein